MKKILISPSITDREVHSLNLYLNDLSKIPLLTREEELKLFKDYKDGDLKAKEKIITHNLRFVVSVAKHYQNMGVLFEDLVQEGNIGLIRQLEKYDPSMELKFITYQVWWIKQQMMQSLSQHSRQIRLPQNRILELDRIYKFVENFEQNHGRSPSTEEIVEATLIDKDSVLNFLELDQNVLYLFDPLSENLNLIDIITD